MAEKNVSTRFSRFVTNVRDVVFLASLIAGLTTVAGGIVFRFVWPHLVEQLKIDLDVATKSDLSALQDKLDTATGEDRITRMPSGHSYVKEPVSVGESITLNLVLSRTQKGASCVFREGVPIFKDERDIPFAGMTIAPIKQIGTAPERMIASLAAPTTLTPGRVSISLNLKFSCPFGPGDAAIDVFEETAAIFFQLDPAQ